MREVDFLPSWYPRLRLRKRYVATQAWATIFIGAGLVAWILVAQRNVRARERELSNLNASLVESVEQVQKLEQFTRLFEQYADQDRIFAKIGRPVEMTRLLTTFEEIMPANMSILDLNVITDEVKPDSIASKAVVEKGGGRVMHMTLNGVAPNDADLAAFLAKLSSRPFFSKVALNYSRPRTENKHLMREFEVTFALDLGALAVR